MLEITSSLLLQFTKIIWSVAYILFHTKLDKGQTTQYWQNQFNNNLVMICKFEIKNMAIFSRTFYIARLNYQTVFPSLSHRTKLY